MERLVNLAPLLLAHQLGPRLHAPTPRAGDEQVGIRTSQGLMHLLTQSLGKWGWCVNSGTSCGHSF